MTKNPFVNALVAALYISGVVGVIQLGQTFLHDEPETFLIPIAMLSLLCLSAATMAGVFFFQPVAMYLEGQKREGVTLALQTIGIFAAITVLLFASLALPSSL